MGLCNFTIISAGFYAKERKFVKGIDFLNTNIYNVFSGIQKVR